MFAFIQEYRVDSALFAGTILIAAVICHRRLMARHDRGIPRAGWLAVVLLMVAGYVAPEIAGKQERGKLREIVAGVAPTYAGEFELAGHSAITLDTPKDNPKYLQLIEAEKRWERLNPGVNDVYTLRKNAEGKPYFVVDSETDYDHDGRYEGERETRTEIGEVYDETTPAMMKTFNGSMNFDDVPVTDRWGTWVSAYVPLRDAAGNVEAILGVDYDAHNWLTAIAWSRLAAIGFVAVIAAISIAGIVVNVMSRAELAERAAAEAIRERLQQQLVLSSRQAGMAEVAVNVLHNVGNVLNSVNVSASMVNENLQKSKVTALSKATAMLQENRANIGDFLTTDAKGKLLPEYLVKLSGVLEAENKSMMDELTDLTRSVEHIKKIVASQQTLAKSVDEREQLDLGEVIDDAVRMNALSLERHGVQVNRQLEAIPKIFTDRHKLLQILVNLISNAKTATKEVAGERRIDIRALRIDGSEPTVAIFVTDNGVGIAPENVSKLFTHGFTTRKDGHGFGLHSSAIAAGQLKGNLTVASAGLGQGATFTLRIPATSPEASLS